MQWARRSNKRIIRIALAMLVLVALLPTLSRLLSHVQSVVAPWGVVCSMDDRERGDAGVDRLTMSTEHCPMCLVHVPGWHAVPTWSHWGVLPAPAQLMPLLFLWAASPLFAWTAARPRAPPTQA